MNKQESLDAANLLKAAFQNMKKVWENNGDQLSRREYLDWLRTDQQLIQELIEVLMAGYKKLSKERLVHPTLPMQDEIVDRMRKINAAMEAAKLDQVHELQMELADYLIAKNDEVIHVVYDESEAGT